MTENRFAGKVLVITGGAGGLGAAIAQEAGLQGGSIAILDTNKAAVDLLVANLRSQGITADGLVVDVRDGASRRNGLKVPVVHAVLLDPITKFFPVGDIRQSNSNLVEQVESCLGGRLPLLLGVLLEVLS